MASTDRETAPTQPGADHSPGPRQTGDETAESASPPRARYLPRLDRRELAAIFAGGAAGTVLRAALANAFPHSPTTWPWPTFGVNVVAAFVLGYAVTRLQERLPLSSYRRPLLGTGLCGGLSTFSTMQVELVRMLDAHAYGIAAAYAGVSIAAGYAGIYAATALVRRAWTRR
jgi:fluoride exporter